MRNPRIDPQKGDVLEHQNGQRRAVMARRDDGLIQYGDPVCNIVSVCSADEWQTWAMQTSILDLGAATEPRT